MTDNSNYPAGVYESDFDNEPDETEEEENERLRKQDEPNDPDK